VRAHHVHVEYEFSKPVDRVFAYLSEHETLGTLFPTRVERVRDGDHDRNGVGSCRRLRIGVLPPFEETVTEFVPNERIVYRITRGGAPIRDHEGDMRFRALPGGGTHLQYRIRLASSVPGAALLVKSVLTRSIARGLPKVDVSA
jgi:uncharacterized protein YndB with AHSA1/START domain